MSYSRARISRPWMVTEVSPASVRRAFRIAPSSGSKIVSPFRLFVVHGLATRIALAGTDKLVRLPVRVGSPRKMPQPVSHPCLDAVGRAAVCDDAKDGDLDVQSGGNCRRAAVRLDDIAIGADIAIDRMRDLIVQAILHGCGSMRAGKKRRRETRAKHARQEMVPRVLA